MAAGEKRRAPDKTLQLIVYVEKVLTEVYRFDALASATTHLLPDLNSGHLTLNLKYRAATIFEELNDDIFIGLYIDDPLIKTLEEKPPLSQLSQDNMDAFCVLVEEVSHFHLILQRKNHDLEASHTELEFQAELDKILLAAHLLFEQVRNPHIFELMEFIFENGVVSLKNESTYKLANEMAQKVWRNCWSTLKQHPSEIQLRLIRSMVRDFYKKSFVDKHSWINAGNFLGRIA